MKLGSVLAITIISVPGLAAAQNGFPVNTNYPALGGSTADLTRVNPIGYDHYSQATTDGYAPTLQEFNASLANASQQSGLAVQAVNSLANVQEGQSYVQILSNHVVGAAAFTLVFPPNWHRTDQRPIFLSGAPTAFTNNYRIFPNGESAITSYAAFRGFISAYCNAGGWESQGVSDNVLRAIGAAMDELGTLGGDKHRIIAAGFSRGASTALVWAANPLGLDYTITAVFGHALPVSFVNQLRAPYATYPMQGSLSDLITNDPAYSTYGSPTPPHQFPNRVLQILTNQQDASEVRSPMAMIEGLRGKQIVFSTHSHDAALPLPDGIAFDRALTAHRIPHATVVVYNEGHTLSLAVAQEFVRALDAIGTGQAYSVMAGRYIASQADVTNHDYTQQALVNQATLPFSMTVPYRAGVGQPFRVDACGAPGTVFKVCAVDLGSGSSIIELNGQIPAEECVQLSGAIPARLGSYAWGLEVGGNPVPRSATPLNGLKPTLTIEAQQPAHAAAMPTPQNVLLGFSELSPQAASDNLACPTVVVQPDAGIPDDAMPTPDMGFAFLDAEEPMDATSFPDASEQPQPDASEQPMADAGANADARQPAQSSTKAVSACGCETTGGDQAGSALALGLLLAFFRRRTETTKGDLLSRHRRHRIPRT
ncbi:MAG: alpha/beta hydrolase [Myxococcota bacterium]